MTSEPFVLFKWQDWFAWYPVMTFDNHIRWFRWVKRRVAVFQGRDIQTFWQYSD